MGMNPLMMDPYSMINPYDQSTLLYYQQLYQQQGPIITETIVESDRAKK